MYLTMKLYNMYHSPESKNTMNDRLVGSHIIKNIKNLRKTKDNVIVEKLSSPQAIKFSIRGKEIIIT